MVTEVIKDSSIPIPAEPLVTPTGQFFRQTQEIPVGINEIIYPPKKYLYVDFCVSSVFIKAGSEGCKDTATKRLRLRMVYALLDAKKTLDSSESSECAKEYAQEKSEILQQFICLHPTPESSQGQ